MIKLLNINSIPNFENTLSQIFFETSAKKTFESDDEKRNFRHKYLDTYWTHNPELFFLALENEKILGYICGREKYTDEDFKNHRYLDSFKESFIQFPAHLHINLTAHARGKGIGSQLINRFCENINSTGVHIFTVPSDSNVEFYKKNKFLHSVEKSVSKSLLLFLGKDLKIR